MSKSNTQPALYDFLFTVSKIRLKGFYSDFSPRKSTIPTSWLLVYIQYISIWISFLFYVYIWITLYIDILSRKTSLEIWTRCSKIQNWFLVNQVKLKSDAVWKRATKCFLVVMYDCFIRFDKTKQSKDLTVLTPGIWKMEFLNGNNSYWTSLKSFGWKEVSFPMPVHSRHSFNWLKNEVLNSLLNRKSTVVLIHFFGNFFFKKICHHISFVEINMTPYGKKCNSSICIE